MKKLKKNSIKNDDKKAHNLGDQPLTLEEKKPHKTMLKGALILTLASVLAKVIGAIYRIPLTNILGGEGIGMYQLVFPIFALLITLASGGTATVIAKLVSENRAKKEDSKSAYPDSQILKLGLVVTIAIALATSIILVGVASPLATFQGIAELKYCYYIIAPTLIFVAVESCFKGYFQGKMNLKPTSYLQIVEQVSKMIVGLSLALVLLPHGIFYAVLGAIIGVSVSEYLCMTMLVILYYAERHKGKEKGQKFGKNSKKKNEISTLNSAEKKAIKSAKKAELKADLTVMAKASLPMTVCAMILPLSQFVDSIMIVNLLQLFGVSHTLAVADYGLLTAPIASLVNLPVMLTLSLAVVIVPLISGYMAERNVINIKQKSEMIIKLNYLISIPCFVGVLFLAKPIMTALYPAFSPQELNLAVVLTMICSINVVLLASLQVYNSLMQALGRTKVVIRNLLFAVVVKIILDIVLIKYIGILGAGVALVISYLLASVANELAYRKLLGNNINILKSVSKISISSGIIGLIALIFRRIISNPYVVIIVVVAISIVLYAILVILGNVFSKDELLTLPYGRKFARMSEAFASWRTKEDDSDEEPEE